MAALLAGRRIAARIGKRGRVDGDATIIGQTAVARID
jgi:hypothetical protein